MKKCYNCKNINKENDKYCRSCGYKINKSYYYILINILTIIGFILLIFIMIIFILSFIIK